MAKKNRFEWYKKYPKDFYDDEDVKLMELQHIGLYNVLLDHAWTNGSIPDNHEELAKIAHVPRATIGKLWPLVGRKFLPSGNPGRLVNPRQEEERKDALEQSEKNKRVGNANASKSKREKNASANESCFFENANEGIRASGSGSSSGFESKNKPETTINEILFENWFGIFIACGVPLNENDKYQSLAAFSELTPEQQAWCYEDCQRKAQTQWRTPTLTKRPWNYLNEQPWTRRSIGRVLPDAAGPESRAEAAQRAAAEGFLKESA